MNADAFRHLYNYHFSANRKLWDQILTLSQEQFTQPHPYSLGSIRNQIVHLMRVDEAWFSDLIRTQIPDTLNDDNLNDRQAIRAHWDTVESAMRTYLANLNDDMLITKPLSGEDENLILWQILLQVANHGTDHRAQILRLINDLGIKTSSQDYIFYVYDNL